MSNIDFKLLRKASNSNTISWDFKTTPKFHVKGFEVYYSQVKDSGFHKIHDDLITEKTFNHILPNYNKLERHHYKIKIIYHNNKEEESEIFDTFQKPSNKYLQSLIKRYLWSCLTNMIPLSLPAVLFQKRIAGTPCSKCAPVPRLGSFQTKCPICLGTGYVSGYYAPTLIWGEYTSDIRYRHQKTELENQSDVYISYRTNGYFAYLRYGDIIREYFEPFRTYMIADMGSVDAVGYPLLYDVTLVQVDSNHPLIHIPVPPPSEIFIDSKVPYIKVEEVYATILRRFKEQFLKLPESKFFPEYN